MKIPFLDLQGQYAAIREEVRAAMDGLCDSQQFILGKPVEALEKEVAAFCEAKHAVGVSSGTDALLVSLMALGVGPGDEVITTSYSFFATAGVISRLGARPVFVDVEPDTLNLDVRKVESWIGPRTRGIIPVHLFGQCADMDAVLELAHRHKLWVVEDAAQAIGAQYNLAGSTRRAGTMGDLGCFSFFPSKTLGGFGDGGMVVTNDRTLAERVEILRTHGSKPKYYHSLIGGNFRLDALQAAVLRVKLPHVLRWIAGRVEKSRIYEQEIRRRGMLGTIRIPTTKTKRDHTFHQYVVRMPRRDELQRFLKDSGVDTMIYYPVPLHAQPCFSNLGYREEDCPEAARAARETLALPIYPELSAEAQSYIVEKIAEFYQLSSIKSGPGAPGLVV
ncbi:MAG: DegT/DnrJ/EryC1/StrS family aminotransferase [Candidatus Tectomicrobia bacterium]|uniref:DegT/DnrJ/EryC1/StrS family aminotransferase n=1 Tax=Tectimicrobiota bacterium TaxID=2528274 RepID=A0A932GMR1_UNCTE|nr:DegT/DnrJ/EryC1/StrS family aminotransferase [Candidatus Tectomicrobia bacterium]